MNNGEIKWTFGLENLYMSRYVLEKRFLPEDQDSCQDRHKEKIWI
jgi:hypothetical protein